MNFRKLHLNFKRVDVNIDINKSNTIKSTETWTHYVRLKTLTECMDFRFCFVRLEAKKECIRVVYMYLNLVSQSNYIAIELFFLLRS